MGHAAESKHLFRRLLLTRGTVLANAIKVLNNQGDIRAAVLSRVLGFGQVVGPVVADCLHNCRAGIVGPHDRGFCHSFGPSSQSSGVGSAHKYPWCLVGIACTVRIKRQLGSQGKVVEVCNGVLQRQVLQILGGQLCEWRRKSPVSVLKDNDGGTNLFRNDAGGSIRACVATNAFSSVLGAAKT